MSFHIPPQDNLDPNVVFDKGCAEWHLKDLTQRIIAELALEDMRAMALECKKAFKPIPPYDDSHTQDKFYKQARTEAEAILEVERKHVVENRATHIRNTLNRVIRSLQVMVFTEHGKGKFYVEKKLVRDCHESYIETDVTFFEVYPEGIERGEQILRVAGQLSDLSEYVPYLSEELSALYTKASNLQPETVQVVKDAETKEEKTESEETPEGDTATA
jgi:hypothetical protein